MSESICWHCGRVRSCLQAEAVETLACSAYESRPMPPGPSRPQARDIANRLWANTPKHLHRKRVDQQAERISELERELAEVKASLARDRDRWKAEAEETQAKVVALEQVAMAALSAPGQCSAPEGAMRVVVELTEEEYRLATLYVPLTWHVTLEQYLRNVAAYQAVLAKVALSDR